MSFQSGSIAFRRFAVVGSQAEQMHFMLLEKLNEFAFKSSPLGIP